eukprot:10907275-Alexandrium_andersonii.AAC.1
MSTDANEDDHDWAHSRHSEVFLMHVLIREVLFGVGSVTGGALARPVSSSGRVWQATDCDALDTEQHLHAELPLKFKNAWLLQSIGDPQPHGNDERRAN